MGLFSMFSKKTSSAKSKVKKTKDGFIVTLDGYTFHSNNWPKDYDGRVVKISEIKISGITYSLYVAPKFDFNKRIFLEEAAYRANLVAIEPNITELNIPQYIDYQGTQFEVWQAKVYNLTQNNDKLKKVIIKSSYNPWWEYSDNQEIFRGCTNIKSVDIPINGGYINLLRLTNLSFTESEWEKNSVVYVSDKYITCPHYSTKTESVTKYGVETEEWDCQGFFYNKSITILSLPSTFFFGHNDMGRKHSIEKRGRKEKEFTDELEEYTCSIKYIILRGNSDKQWKYRFIGLPQWKESYRKMFKNTILYVDKNNYRTIIGQLGMDIFKEIKMFDDIPTEYKDLIK